MRSGVSGDNSFLALMYSTVRGLILLVFLVCWSIACGGGQSSDQSVRSTETITPKTEGRSSKETSGPNLTRSGSSDGGSNVVVTPSLKGQIAKGGTERSSTSEPMLKFFDPTADGFGFANFSGGSGAATGDRAGTLLYVTEGGTMYLDVSSYSASLTRDYMITVDRIGP